MLRILALPPLLAILTGLAPVALDDSKSIDGNWAMTSFEESGEPQTPDRIKGRVLSIEGSHFTDRADDKVLAEGTLTLDQSRTPWKLDATFTEGAPKGSTVKAIAELKDGKLRICAADPDNDRPTRFETGTDSGAGAWLVEYKKKP